MSNFSTAQFDLLQSRIDSPLVTNQIEINPVNLEHIENGMLENLQKIRVSPMAWSCLAGGQIFLDNSDKMKRLLRVLNNISKELDVNSIDQIIYAWVMKLPCNPIPIIGTGNIDRISAAVKSLNINMSHEQWYRILEASRGHMIA